MEITHRRTYDVIHGMLRFMPSLSKDKVIQLASVLMEEEGATGQLGRLEVVSTGTLQWGILLSYRYNSREEYIRFCRRLTKGLVPRFTKDFNWSISNDVTVIERKG